MTAMDFPTSPTNGQQTADGRYYFDSSVGSEGAWRSTPLPVGGLPAGSIMAWGTNTPPTNWLLADGSAVSRATYSSLFAVIGTQYGSGNGTTTFNLPDLRGRVPVGKNAGTFGTLGATGGAETHTLTEAEIPSHTHGFQKLNWGVATGTSASASYINTERQQTDATGGGQAHNNLQPYQVVNYIIKASAGWTAGDSELATRVGALETADATNNKSGLVPVIPSTIVVSGGSATGNANAIVSFSAATSLSLNNVFVTPYKHYRILIKMAGSSLGAAAYIRFRKTGTDATSNSFFWSGAYSRSTGNVGSWNGHGVSSMDIGRLHTNTTSQKALAVIDIIGANASQSPVYSFNWAGEDSTSPLGGNGVGTYALDDSYDGLTLFTSAGTMTGTIQVYGYR